MSLNIFQEIIAYSPLPVIVVQDGFIRLVNPGTAYLTGYTAEELLQLLFTDLIHPEDRERVVGDAQLLHNGPLRIVHKEGSVRLLEMNAVQVNWEGKTASLNFLTDMTGRERAEEKLRESEKELRKQVNYLNLLIDNMNEVFFTYDVHGSITFVNKKSWEVLKYRPEELIGRNLLEFVHDDYKERVKEGISARLEKGESGSYETLVLHRDGIKCYVKLNASPIIEDGKITGGMVLAEDITGRKRMEEELILQKAYFQQLFDNSPEGIIMLDNNDRIISVNKGFEKLFQYSVEEARGRYIDEIIVPENLSGEASSLSGVVLGGEVVQKESVRRRKDGSLVDVSILAYPIALSGKQVGMYAIYSDITERKRAEEQLKYLSLHDPLTGLCNRAYFEQEMRRLEGGCCGPVGIILCDIDGLKLVNDTLGHDTGDNLLVIAARILRDSFRGDDMVARIGGDEFAVLLANGTRVLVESACNRIQNAVARYNTANPELLLSISIGFAVSNEALLNPGDLFKEADNNMYREKLYRSQSVRSAIIQTLMKTLEARDFLTEGHAERLQNLVAGVGMAVEMSVDKITALRLLAQFHDIGKVGIPDRILFKPGSLTSGEVTEMQRHCEIGHRIAQSAPDLIPIAQWILSHHEWWNGKGYPIGLRGEGIPLECRILSIADAYDAMTSDRPYRNAMTREEAVAELRRCAGTQFDPWLVQKFVEVLEKRGTQTVKAG